MVDWLLEQQFLADDNWADGLIGNHKLEIKVLS